LNLNSGNYGGSTILFVLCGETCLLASLCVGDSCGMTGCDEDRGRSRRLGVEDWGWSSTVWVLDVWTIERSSDPVCGLHRAQGARVSWFSLKIKDDGFSRFGHKTGGYSLLVVWPQNH
jgi:hypothetical protein